MKIFIIGWFGAGNVGDEAILLSMLTDIGETLPDTEFTVLSFNAENTAALLTDNCQVKQIVYFGSKLCVFNSDFVGVWRSLRSADLVIIGGGGLFQDIYNWYPIPFFTLMTLLAKLLGKPIMFYALGIGPLRTWFGRKLCRLAAGMADLISVRDEESKKLLLDLGIDQDIYITADPVFALSPAPAERAKEILAREGVPSDGRLKVGIAIHELLPWDKVKKQELAHALDELAERRDASLVFIPFGQYTDSWFGSELVPPVDLRFSLKMARMLTHESTVLTGRYTPREVMAIVGQMDLMISMRLHGLIMATAMGVPAIGLTYRQETKLKNLRPMGQELHILEVNDLEQEQLVLLLELILTERDFVSPHLRERASVLRQIARRNAKLVSTLGNNTTIREARLSFYDSGPGSDSIDLSERSGIVIFDDQVVT
jgi:polysaccharide pyruvyl transferase CsaB